MTISASKTGTLYIVATPIGHRNDITIRAQETLASVDAILAEDTRHSQLLLTHLGINKALISLHSHNEAQKTASIITALQTGQSFALISDAGTPLISDPGYPLVKEARSLGIDVVPIPGPCAFVAALSAAGIPCDTFTFYGFLPAKPLARRHKLEQMRMVPHTVIFYESTHRLLACLDDIMSVFSPDVELVLAKELTKAFEQIKVDDCSTIKAWLLEDPARIKGEFVLILPTRPTEQTLTDETRLLSLLLEALPVRQAAQLASKITGSSKNELYQVALQLQKR